MFSEKMDHFSTVLAGAFDDFETQCPVVARINANGNMDVQAILGHKEGSPSSRVLIGSFYPVAQAVGIETRTYF